MLRSDAADVPALHLRAQNHPAGVVPETYPGLPLLPASRPGDAASAVCPGSHVVFASQPACGAFHALRPDEKPPTHCYPLSVHEEASVWTWSGILSLLSSVVC